MFELALEKLQLDMTPLVLDAICATPPFTRHHLRICDAVHMVWQAICLFLTRAVDHHGFVTWGAFAWLMLMRGPRLFFEGGRDDSVFMLTSTCYF